MAEGRSETARTAVVTGGGSGMGRAVCQRLATEGHGVAVLDIDSDASEQVAKEIESDGGRALAVVVDVSDRAAVDAAMDRARAAFGPVGILVTSAGIEGFSKFLDIDVATWERILAVNLTGTFHCAQAVVPDMVAAGWGRIVTISSSSAQSGTKRMAHYVASKGGVIALTKALALDLAPNGITVNTIPPGAIDTPMMRRPIESGVMASLDQIVARAPLGRLGTPDDIAAACAFLCSEEAGYITGQQINVNGAWYL
ncbi:MAG TPA: SDR family NAD(P)-dependent oxidoreductase [Acidimicrobiales bacterium]|jgi:NAD(P)-dependent dehydrogenase (short-subunit alcohol dehydrogenase family)|nr:SDR family NAD(P)-dependent oxidoreductase [Acidimicrobiales bacterium]